MTIIEVARARFANALANLMRQPTLLASMEVKAARQALFAALRMQEPAIA